MGQGAGPAAGTEPKVRVMAQGRDDSVLQEVVDAIRSHIIGPKVTVFERFSYSDIESARTHGVDEEGLIEISADGLSVSHHR